ncbi:MAG: 1-acyl-sn-glycerol-3-phosphate acyltransferase, partial [Dehalococcoidia bacterium]|nr:1-acyl-sn-glycerol-3-phosphate acyltransferase [Dehalococcoidia bacterium]
MRQRSRLRPALRALGAALIAIIRMISRRAIWAYAQWDLRDVRVSVFGLEHLPPGGPVLVVARHFHNTHDAAILVTRLRRFPRFVVGVDWARGQRFRRFFSFVLWLAEAPRLLRPETFQRPDTGSPPRAYAASEVTAMNRRALRDAVELLRAGRLVVIFPEGYPTVDPEGSMKQSDDDFLPFKAGFVAMARLAQRD